MDYSADIVFSGAAMLAAKGWKIVQLYGVRENGRCTCGRQECQNPGKHPAGGVGWQHRATDDEARIAQWFESIDEDHQRVNVGVRLGPASGIVDVEFDSPEAEAVMRKYGLDKIDTPTYRAGRGEHRIWVHEEWMPNSAVVKVDGLEVRIGGGEMASQSVVPPSWHRTGAQYRWLPEKSPDDVHPARLPEEFREAVLAASRKHGSGVIAQARESLRAMQKIREGGRHAFLLGVASRNAARIAQFTDAEREELHTIMMGVNAIKCDPPKSESEVAKIANDQFAYFRDRQIERRAKKPFERYGLKWNFEEGCWEPGGWHLTIVESDPVQYRLSIPNPDDSNRPYIVRMDSRQIVGARDVAIATLEETKWMDLLDPNPARWTAIWNGETQENADGDRRVVRGLKSKLFDEAARETPPRDENASCGNAGILLAYFRLFKQMESDDENDNTPNHSGVPKWIKVGGEWALAFKWHEAIAASWKRASVPVISLKEKRAFKAQILAESGDEGWETTKKRSDDQSSRWVVFRERHIRALEVLSGSI